MYAPHSVIVENCSVEALQSSTCMKKEVLADISLIHVATLKF
jgi:hypothetical protein